MTAERHMILAAAGLAVATALLWGTQALAEVKRQEVNPGHTSALRYANAAYTLTCWQEGQQVLQDKGAGNVVLSRTFIDRTITISPSEPRGPVLTIFSTDTAICRLSTQPGGAR